MTPHITRLHFAVDQCEALEAFYCDSLGMDLRHRGECYEFAFPGADTALTFSTNAASRYQYSSRDSYWKIGITVPALDAAVDYLRERGIAVSEPKQFRDIGYLAHLKDPCGFTIELLQHGFIGAARSVRSTHPLAINATLAHLSLRVRDLETARRFFVDNLGMRLISVQAVGEHNFCLYFFTWSNETTPVEDLTAIENREWLWRRPYTMIELQHLQGADTPLVRQPENMCRFTGFSYTDNPEHKDKCIEICQLSDFS